MGGSAFRFIKSIVKVVTFFFFDAPFSRVLALNLFLSFTTTEKLILALMSLGES